MSKPTEYRVRAVTRYVVTEHDPVEKTTTQIAEVDSGGTATLIAETFAASANKNRPAVAVPMTDALPGKVMRCKVVLHTRVPQWGANVDEKGDYVGRTIDRVESYQDREYRSKVPDPTDPANVKPDGERLMFGAVCKGFDKAILYNPYPKRLQRLG